MRSFDETLQFVSDLQNAQTLDEVRRRLLSLSSLYGLDKVIVGTLPDPGLSRADQHAHILTHNWPAEWLEHYLREDYIDCDPLVRVMRTQYAPVAWTTAAESSATSNRCKLMFDELAQFKMKDGIAVPVVTLEGVTVSVSLAGEVVELDPREIGMLQLAAMHTVTRAMQLAEIAKSQVGRRELTLRERECIRWAALGKSEWEISQILGISEHTSEKHLLSAKSKLGAVNRVQAVAEAIRLGYIT